LLTQREEKAWAEDVGFRLGRFGEVWEIPEGKVSQVELKLKSNLDLGVDLNLIRL